jgi:hypothetical protein
MAKHITVLSMIFTLLVGNTFAQSYGIGGGIDILNPVNRGFYIPGLTVFVDIPRNETVVPFGKIGYFFPISVDNPNGVQLEALDPMTNPYFSTATTKDRVSLFNLEFGTKYFVGNDYDIGLSALFETKLRLLIAPVKQIIGPYDTGMYRVVVPPGSTNQNYTSIQLYAGFAAGAKYSQPWGTIFTTVGLDLGILQYFQTPITSPFLFSMNIGYRRDFY